MKAIPPVCPEPEVGPQYFRSPEAMADSARLQEWAELEFPAGAAELTVAESRRDFMKLMSASFALAGFGLTGCRRPTEHIYPFGKQPEGYIHGVPQHFATAMPWVGGAVGLLVESHEGRPTKVEGTPSHPSNRGTTSTFACGVSLSLRKRSRLPKGRLSTTSSVTGTSRLPSRTLSIS